MDAGGPSNLRLSSSRSSLRGGEIGVIGVRGVLKFAKIMNIQSKQVITEVKQLCELPLDGVWLRFGKPSASRRLMHGFIPNELNLESVHGLYTKMVKLSSSNALE